MAVEAVSCVIIMNLTLPVSVIPSLALAFFFFFFFFFLLSSCPILSGFVFFPWFGGDLFSTPEKPFSENKVRAWNGDNLSPFPSGQATLTCSQP